KRRHSRPLWPPPKSGSVRSEKPLLLLSDHPALAVAAPPAPTCPSLLLFHHTLQRMLMLASEIHHLRHFGLGDLVSVDAALADPVMMHMQHDLGRRFRILLEEPFQHMDDEL